MAGITIMFDFDKTIINVDNDNWVVDEFGATDLFNERASPHHVVELPYRSNDDGATFTIEEIKEVLRRAPIQPSHGCVPTIKKVHALGCDLRIVSDVNLYFIEIIVDHLGLKDCLSEINTNPSYVSEEGRLRISPFIDFKGISSRLQPLPSKIFMNIFPFLKKGMIIDGQGTEANNHILRRWERRFLPEFKAREVDLFFYFYKCNL